VFRNVLIYVLLFCLTSNAQGQSALSSFFKLPCPEKWWVIKHPFIAKNVYKLSLEAVQVTRSLLADSTLDGDMAGGQLDAFRHTYWMAIVSQKYGKKKAFSLGKAHEKGNYLQFKKGLFEDGVLPDYESSLMDFLNNDVGIEIGSLYKNASKEEIKKIVIEKIHEGKLYILKKDSAGNYLNCQNEKLLLNQKKWITNKCIIPSNTK